LDEFDKRLLKLQEIEDSFYHMIIHREYSKTNI